MSPMSTNCLISLIHSYSFISRARLNRSIPANELPQRRHLATSFGTKMKTKSTEMKLKWPIVLTLSSLDIVNNSSNTHSCNITRYRKDASYAILLSLNAAHLFCTSLGLDNITAFINFITGYYRLQQSVPGGRDCLALAVSILRSMSCNGICSTVVQAAENWLCNACAILAF